MKRLFAMLLALTLLLSVTACGKEDKIVHCDHCGDEITLDAGSNIEEDWIVFCATCEEELFGENPVVSPG